MSDLAEWLPDSETLLPPNASTEGIFEGRLD